jgi:hypothetical protein
MISKWLFASPFLILIEKRESAQRTPCTGMTLSNTPSATRSVASSVKATEKSTSRLRISINTRADNIILHLLAYTSLPFITTCETNFRETTAQITSGTTQKLIQNVNSSSKILPFKATVAAETTR